MAQKLDYGTVGPELLGEVARRRQTPLPKLVAALGKQQPLLKLTPRERRRLLAYLEAATRKRLAQGEAATGGLAVHLFIVGVPHVRKVRIIADLEAPGVAAEMRRENISQSEARSPLLKDDAERRKWTQTLYDVDPWDASLYDLVIHIHKLTVADAGEFIVQAAGRQCFQATPESQRKMDDLALACRIKAALIKQECFDLGVTSEYGNVVVYTKQGGRHHHRLDEKLGPIRRSIVGINRLEVREGLPCPPNAV